MRRFLSPKIYFFAFLFIAIAWAFIAYRETTQSQLPEAGLFSPPQELSSTKESDCPSFSISGATTDLEGVEIVASGPVISRQISEKLGTFAFCGLPPGDYTVYALSLDKAFEPVFFEVTIQDEDIKNLIFLPIERTDYVPVEILENIDKLPPLPINPPEDIILFDGTTLKEAMDRWGHTINVDFTEQPQETDPGAED